jgi:hypothetical protein
MFTEVGFSDSDIDEPARSRKTHRTEMVTVSEASNELVQVTLHHPSHPQFRHSAGIVEGDEPGPLGPQWLSQSCHCLRCDILRAGQLIQQLPQTPVVVLLDLDNWGFNQLKGAPPKKAQRVGNSRKARQRAKRRNDPLPELLLQQTFFWCFFGSYFVQHFGVHPEEFVFHEAPKGSIWCRLKDAGRVTFTPCGGHLQAADGVITRIAAAMGHCPVVVLSGDLALIDLSNSLLSQRAGSDGLALALANGESLASVWHRLANAVAHVGGGGED